MTEVNAFGQTFDLNSTAEDFLRDDSLWRLKNIYEPALATQVLAEKGVALDIGAGFGAFAIPFAATFRGWQVYCFEPDPANYDALCQNIATHGLANIVPVPFAVGCELSDAAEDSPEVRRVLSELGQASGAIDQLRLLLPLRNHSKHLINIGFLQRDVASSDDFEIVRYPTIAAKYLSELSPRFLKLMAPQAEAAILADMTEFELDHIIGESWGHVPASLIYENCAGQRHTELPLVGPPLINLRRSPDLSGRKPGLDVVVAMFNSKPFILECIAGILNGDSTEIHAIIVDDGSTDGARELIDATYGNDPRVSILWKPNGGCASARNFGRMHSKASHIAFADADDIPGPNLYSGLLDLARHTGAELVQGGFETLNDDGAGGFLVEPSYEATDQAVQSAQRYFFGDKSCYLLPSEFLMRGQPSIWRRVYRRDFLENRNIWFPEHIRAFDDQIFQILTLQAVNNVPMLEGVAYGYRQHAGQDIRQGDERNFYSLEMFRLILKRGMSEGWPRFDAVLESYINTVNWISAKLRPDLYAAFIKGAAELWVYTRKCLGEGMFEHLPVSMFQPPEFAEQVAMLEAKLRSYPGSYAWAYLDSFEMQVPLMKSIEAKV